MQESIDKQKEKEQFSENTSHSRNNAQGSMPVTEIELDKSWSGLYKRYVRVWKSKFRDTSFRKGVASISYVCLNSALLGTILSQLPTTPFAVASAPIAMILGMAGGVMVSSYMSGLDDFTNAHIGGLVGLVLTLYLAGVSIVTGTSPILMAGLAIAGIWYIVALSVAAVGYGVMGRWFSEDYSVEQN